MRSPLATILPLCSALAYPVAAMMLKRASSGEGGRWRVTALTNWIAALVFLPWWMAGGQELTWKGVAQAALGGALFFAGQVLTFLAISRGDVSLTTPVMGSKVIFVAFGATLLAGDRLSGPLWLSAVLTVAATVLLSGEIRAHRERVLPSVGFGFAAALAYALTDITQVLWVPNIGFGRFAPIMFGTVALLSVGLIPLFEGPLRAMDPAVFRWTAGGALMLGLQATGIAYCLGIFREVTLTNILYNTRGMWSVVLVWAIGSWFSNTERSIGNALMLRRLAGAALLLLAVFTALQRHAAG
jgi:drug/metabolite transporter (DMT)-like permease